MILPGLLAVIVPVVVGKIFRPEALGGLLIGSIVVGFLLAIMMANAGGAGIMQRNILKQAIMEVRDNQLITLL
ncbi:MAG: hypothetical protein CM1200mP38_3010 [Dehalococcoidia bacterium]|nr:MAG: hypothetical protein CM1200mP38_3010 [Dehalococcoidia bacterium]